VALPTLAAAPVSAVESDQDAAVTCRPFGDHVVADLIECLEKFSESDVAVRDSVKDSHRPADGEPQHSSSRWPRATARSRLDSCNSSWLGVQSARFAPG
jgi:hypothetical protein